MFAFIRYTTYLIIILLCLFFLQKMGVDVKSGFWKSVEQVKVFSKSIGDAAEKKDNAAVTDIIKQDMIGHLNGTTTVKSYISSSSSTKDPVTQNPGMSIDGVLKYTNIQRQANGLKPLILNTKLSNSALAKVEDMFALQYFEHISPTGKSASDLVRAEGYDFQSVGENLALGDFGTDKKLVEAWMNSPLHRKNILNPKFTEIGLAVAKGTYKDERQWLAVQHFGKLAPVCESVSSTIKKTIDTEKGDLETEEQELKKFADEIENDPNQNKGQTFLDAYNTRVANYNARLGVLRDLIKDYNVRIEAYNTCLVS
jgi:uncharacterized protein YkwD